MRVTDLWEAEGFGGGGAAPGADGDVDWDEGDESLEAGVADGFDDLDGELEDDGWDEGDKE